MFRKDGEIGRKTFETILDTINFEWVNADKERCHMKKVWKVALSLAVILLIGGGVAYAMGIDKDYFRYLEVKNYTEDYIEPSQNNEGFVSYKSINGKFSFEFPESFFIDPKFHHSSNSELFHANYVDPEKKDANSISNYIRVNYRDLEEENVIDVLNMTLNDHSYNERYEEINLENRTIYKGENHLKVEEKVTPIDPVKNGTNHYFALVVDNKTFQSLQITYSIVCPEEDERKCIQNEVKDRETFETIIESISFK